MNHPTTQKKILKNKWVLTAAGTVLLLGIALLLLPVATKLYLTKWLLENGADTAVIQKIRINPLSGTIAIKGSTVTLGGNTVLSNADISFHVGMLSLFKKHADIKKAVLEGVTLDVELYEDGRMSFGSYKTTPAAPHTLEEPEG
ncbi:MAG: hypothetical protein L3J49_08025, partial [Desulfobulbaceae bacterium]|nr:hypothetical protein [Desulfobulbaceae bacterium]